MRFATFVENGRSSVAVVRDGRLLPLALPGGELGSMREIAAGGEDGLQRVREWVQRQRGTATQPIDGARLGPAVPDPGAIFTVGLNYPSLDATDEPRAERPLIYAKSPGAVASHDSVLTWDRSLTDAVDPESELGVVMGRSAFAVTPQDAMDHVFGYTVINDISSRDPWLDGDQWLLGKSFAGFCPVGPTVVTRDEVTPENLQLGCTINGVAVQEGNTAQMRFSIPEMISYISRHVTLHPGDLIASGTPTRLAGPMGPERHLEIGDVVTVWVEQVGELSTTIA